MAKLWLILAGLLLTGCASYQRDFDCPHAKGANCMSMDQVDVLITSGKIKEYTGELVGSKSCQGRKCNAKKRGAK